MSTIQVTGFLTPDGKIELDLPEGWQSGEVQVSIIIEPTFTDEELDEMMVSNPKPANQIETGGWEDVAIDDSVEWVKNQRRKNQRDNQW